METRVKHQAGPQCRVEVQEELRSDGVWTIGEMAREFRVSLRALRFYEDRGLLHPHWNGSARLYRGRDRLHLQMVLKGKQLGFTLSEIGEILRRDDSGQELNLPPEQIIAQIRHIERQLRTLETALAELRLAHQRATAQTAA